MSLAVAAFSFSGCEDPSGPQITMTASGTTGGGYTATIAVTQTVYSGPYGTVTAQASDTITRTDGGTFSNTGAAQVQYQNASSRFSATIGVNNIGGGNIGGSVSLRWKF